MTGDKDSDSAELLSESGGRCAFTFPPALALKKRHAVQLEHLAVPYQCRVRRRAVCMTDTGDSGVNVKKLKSQRSIMSAEKNVTPEEINTLLVKAGKKARDVDKWRLAIEHSYVVITARLLATNELIGFARATSDRALNGTIWDLVTDPALPNRPLMTRNIVNYLLKEIRRTVPTCSIAVRADPDQIRLLEGLDFVVEPDGIVEMILSKEEMDRIDAESD